MHNFLASGLATNGRNGVFIVMTPQYTIEDFRNVDPLKMQDGTGEPQEPLNPLEWRQHAKAHELVTTNILQLIHGKQLSLAKGAQNPFTENLDREVIKLIEDLAAVPKLPPIDQFNTKYPERVYEPPVGFSHACLQQLCKSLHKSLPRRHLG
jgi:hypothetical protein